MTLTLRVSVARDSFSPAFASYIDGLMERDRKGAPNLEEPPQ